MSNNIPKVTPSSKVNDVIQQITQRIISRSQPTRKAYLERIENARRTTVHRAELACGNLAHGFAACQSEEKQILKSMTRSDIAIITSYNDMLSAHRPYDSYPEKLKQALLENGAIGQVASGVPAMCDGVTQGQDGMELSLLSRDVIAMSTAIGLSHNMFDGALYLGICDKIVPGLMIGALSFGHLPAIFVPAGPMSTGLPNKEKVRIRQLYAEGKVDRSALLEAEAASYHGIGTCTFYGTANSNQMVMEVMGLHLPGASFVPPDSPLRDALNIAAARQITRLTEQSGNYLPIGQLVDEKVIVNGIVALLATGGSTNLTMHLVAIARAAGIIINWDDFSDLSAIVPLICRIYPNGQADINQFQASGGVQLLIRQLLSKGLLHDDVNTVVGFGLSRYTMEPWLDSGQLAWREGAEASYNLDVIADINQPFSAHGGTKLLSGNLGRAMMKTSAVPVENQVIEAPAIVFNNQNDIAPRFEAGELDRDCVIVVRFQGPSANGMPELHKLMPPLGVLLDKGYKVALVTDGRLSGASGKVPSAIHVTPEAYNGGLLAKVQDGDLIRVDALTGEISLLVDEHELAARQPYQPDLSAERVGCGRELFGALRTHLSGAEEGACSLNF
ncbi:phosphogluconate dehydratase [Providencia rustigianii]|uniref:phosphogluconate dehydratase n=1 Tax=Providencia rustigianii TaxID=158850 RepID=UPI000F6EDC84|nr:phosphogluconate dehydratase [Providencia rustigianii]MTC59837.1 phosphogluconate dehydratase [Providencia rustigianii]VEH53562.1 Dihydroxy-acid dehydratase [Providencia rustigianii]